MRPLTKREQIFVNVVGTMIIFIVLFATYFAFA